MKSIKKGGRRHLCWLSGGGWSRTNLGGIVRVGRISIGHFEAPLGPCRNSRQGLYRMFLAFDVLLFQTMVIFCQLGGRRRECGQWQALSRGRQRGFVGTINVKPRWKRGKCKKQAQRPGQPRRHAEICNDLYRAKGIWERANESRDQWPRKRCAVRSEDWRLQCL